MWMRVLVARRGRGCGRGGRLVRKRKGAGEGVGPGVVSLSEGNLVHRRGNSSAMPESSRSSSSSRGSQEGSQRSERGRRRLQGRGALG